MSDLKKSDFFYFLPDSQIAQEPASPRDSSRLLYYDRGTDLVKNLHFFDILDILTPNDLLVINNTRVIPARLKAFDKNGREYEVLLLKRLDLTRWEVLLKPAKKAKIGCDLVVNSELSLKIEQIIDNGVRIVSFKFNGVFEDILAQAGEMPLPPYITKRLNDKEKYQTVYAKTEGSSAAPTAGLHFSVELMERLKSKGVEIAEVLLHVGLGTFRPVKTDNIKDHKMHSEYYEITPASAAKINNAITAGKRIVAVGTTSVRTLESAADESGQIKKLQGNTDIFIYPPYKFKVVNGIITNFHLPESTLIMLVSAFCNRQKILDLYNHAVKEGYRFFSFGDAMLLL